MISAHQTGRVRTSVVQRLPKPRRRVRLPYPAPSSRTKKDIYAKSPEVSTVSPHRYTMCHGGYSRYGQKQGANSNAWVCVLLFYIRIELDRSNVDGRSFQALTDKMLCFQGLYGFYRKHPVSLNFLKTIENTGQTGFLRISDDSSQIVVTVISLPEIIWVGIIVGR